MLANPAEFIICLIKENCNNPDDLSKIAVSVECLLEELDASSKQSAPTMKQLLVQNI